MAERRKEILVQSKLEHRSVIGSYLESQILDLGLLYMDGKIRHRPKTFMGVQDLKRLFSSSNCKLYQQRRSPNLFCSPDTVQCSAHISSFKSPNVLIFFVGKLREFPRTIMTKICSNSNISNDILFRQEDRDCDQVKMWSPTQQLVIKSMVLNFGL